MGSRRILGVFISCPGDIDAGIKSLYKEFDTIGEFTQFTIAEMAKCSEKSREILTFESCV